MLVLHGLQDGHRQRPRRIELVEDVADLGELLHALGTAQVVVDFIARAVDDDAGVIAVAEDGVGHVALPPLAEVEMVVLVGVLADRPDVEHLVHDQEPHAVADVEELGRRRVVGRADGVDPQRLEVARRRSQTLSGTAAPNAPPSLWTQTPRSLKFLPLSQKPVSALKTASRMPKGTVWESITLSPETTLTVAL